MSENIETIGWGVQLTGDPRALQRCADAFKPPFDPYIEVVDFNERSETVLRSKRLDKSINGQDAHYLGIELAHKISTALDLRPPIGPIAAGFSVQFLANGDKRRHHFVHADVAAISMVGCNVTVTVADADGHVIQSPSKESQPQCWIRASFVNERIADAIRHTGPDSDWVGLYKAYEALTKKSDNIQTPPFVSFGISKSTIKQFTGTANSHYWHSEFTPPPSR